MEKKRKGMAFQMAILKSLKLNLPHQWKWNIHIPIWGHEEYLYQ